MKSDVVKRGVERAPHRSLLRAVGWTSAEIDKPLIGIVNSFSEIVPGHIHLRDIAEAVKAGVRSEGGIPFEFNTIAVCDGIAMNHPGMKYSLRQDSPWNAYGSGKIESTVYLHQRWSYAGRAFG